MICQVLCLKQDGEQKTTTEKRETRCFHSHFKLLVLGCRLFALMCFPFVTRRLFVFVSPTRMGRHIIQNWYEFAIGYRENDRYS